MVASSALFLRYWRSTLLVSVLILLDALVLLGGLDLPILRSLHWLQKSPFSPRGLWNPPNTHSLDAFALLWWIRILTVGKFVLSLGLARSLLLYHANRLEGREVVDRLGRLLMIFACWHLLLTSVQLPTFWIAYLPQVGVGYWTQLGPAPLVATVGMSIEVLMVCVAAYYADSWNNGPNLAKALVSTFNVHHQLIATK